MQRAKYVRHFSRATWFRCLALGLWLAIGARVDTSVDFGDLTFTSVRRAAAR